LVIWITYRSTDRIERLMGPAGSRTVTRLSAFLLLCIGVQILITGVGGGLGALLRPPHWRRPLSRRGKETQMAFSMFQATIPVCTQVLGATIVVVDKAAAHCAEKKYDEAALLSDRLFPDMFTLARQFRQVSDFGRNIPGRLAGGALPDF